MEHQYDPDMTDMRCTEQSRAAANQLRSVGGGNSGGDKCLKTLSKLNRQQIVNLKHKLTRYSGDVYMRQVTLKRTARRRTTLPYICNHECPRKLDDAPCFMHFHKTRSPDPSSSCRCNSPQVDTTAIVLTHQQRMSHGTEHVHSTPIHHANAFGGESSHCPCTCINASASRSTLEPVRQVFFDTEYVESE